MMMDMLHNPNPGITFRACDMVRNLLLSSVMDLPLEEQVAYYRSQWLEPFVQKHIHVGGEDYLDVLIEAFVEKSVTALSENATKPVAQTNPDAPTFDVPEPR